MKLDHGNEIKFDGTYDEIVQFVVVLDGEPTMNILCDITDPERVIKIRSAGTGDVQDTKGRFTMTEKLLEDADGAPLGVEPRVDTQSVYRYVVPRLHSLLGRLLRAA